MSLYKTIADQIESMIKSRSMRFGDKLPSVRSFSKSRGVSSTTVLEAYRLLESKELIEARPRSGYYVSLRPDPRNYSMAPSGWLKPTATQVSDTMPQILNEIGSDSIFNLSAANPDYSILPTRALARITREVLRTQTDSLTSYGNPQGLFLLRRRLVDLMLERGAAANANDITVTGGCQQALRLAFEQIAARGDIVAVESPTYPGALQVLKQLSLKSIEIPSSSKFGIDIECLAKAAKKHPIAACYVMPRCSNPLGASMNVDSLRQLYSVASDFDITIVEDDTNWGLGFKTNSAPSLKSMDTEQRVIYCSSFSKSIAPALRVGWVIAERLTEEVVLSKYMHDMGCPALPQMVVAKYLSEKRFSKDLERMRAAHANAVSELADAVRRYFPEGTTPVVPSGGFTVWTELPANVSGGQLREAALEKGISIAPGTTFSGRDSYKNYLRLGWGGEWNETVGSKIEILGKICKTMDRSSR